MRAMTLSLILCCAGCGGATGSAALVDASSGPGDDAAMAPADAGGLLDVFSPFDQDAAAAPVDAPEMAQGECDPPCSEGQVCLARVIRGGGRLMLDPLDAGVEASIGCHPVPSACEPQAACPCLLQALGPDCVVATPECVVDDAGRPTIECVIFAP